jgi:hypothetical protein
MAAGVKDSMILFPPGLGETKDLFTDLRNSFDCIIVKSDKYSKRLENC